MVFCGSNSFTTMGSIKGIVQFTVLRIRITLMRIRMQIRILLVTWTRILFVTLMRIRILPLTLCGPWSGSQLPNKGSKPWKSAQIGSYSIHLQIDTGFRIRILPFNLMRIRNTTTYCIRRWARRHQRRRDRTVIGCWAQPPPLPAPSHTIFEFFWRKGICCRLRARVHCKKRLAIFPVPSRDVTNQLSLAGKNSGSVSQRYGSEDPRIHGKTSRSPNMQTSRIQIPQPRLGRWRYHKCYL